MFNQWVAVLVDSLNETIQALQSAVLSVNPITTTTQAAQINSNYVPINVGATTITLHDLAAVGSRVVVSGFGAGGWVLVPGAGQTIKVASAGASAGTSITSTSRYDSISIVCVVADTTWITQASETAGFIIV
jgi:hypothetical protein